MILPISPFSEENSGKLLFLDKKLHIFRTIKVDIL